MRIQGAYISDEEIENVVDFLKRQSISTGEYSGNGDIEKEINIDYDPYFVEAGRVIINKDKASIGVYKGCLKLDSTEPRELWISCMELV